MNGILHFAVRRAPLLRMSLFCWLSMTFGDVEKFYFLEANRRFHVLHFNNSIIFHKKTTKRYSLFRSVWIFTRPALKYLHFLCLQLVVFYERISWFFFSHQLLFWFDTTKQWRRETRLYMRVFVKLFVYFHYFFLSSLIHILSHSHIVTCIIWEYCV